jgi:hypothetical protein
MQRSVLEDIFDGMNDKLFFFLIIIVQFVFIFQGLDFTDSGFDADFYSRIFNDPSAVQYNFIHWFTGIIGGSWLKIFPGMGLLGLRIAGIFFTTLTFAITYDLLKSYLHTGPLRLSLFLIILFLATSVKEINYNDISAFFFVCTSWFLFTGLTKEKYYMLFVAGLFISLNTFSHIPNLLGLALILIIWFSAYLNRHSVKRVLLQSFNLVMGFILMSIALIIFMIWMRHDVIYLNSLKLARLTGSIGEHSRGLMGMLKIYIFHYGEAISIALLVLVVLWSSSAAWRRIRTDLPASIPFLRFVKFGLMLLLTITCLFLSGKDPHFWFYLFLFYAGLSLIVGFLIVTGRQPRNLRLLAAIGCFMLLLMPVGNSMDLMIIGKYALWIIVPITIDFLLNIRALSSRIVVSENHRHSYEQVIDEKHMTGLRNACIYLTLIFILSVTWFYPYFDQTNRMQMHYQVNNPHLHGIYTSEKRARVINELLRESALFVKPDDYVLAYDCIPMYYYLTDTRPFMHNSWLWLYEDTVFKTELNQSLRETHIFPVVIMQKRNSIGNNWPDNDDVGDQVHPVTLNYLRDFLKSNQYNQAWENDFFRIYTPPAKLPSLAENFIH